ncbi:MoaD/ThiS family protein [Arthrobacter sp. NamB2]|uniref:MoaD/ThiS family protein n=1 Tax=Arthrobacter sp. NamB2 TaxID=2576035 RepID=UPI0010C9CBFD|nr:MoaD/ThiS family protein [Arthrobacter sp. NamB2]TKV28034.1 MoaD/ThiS family protein [Arthrobacter sp. NamB2]
MLVRFFGAAKAAAGVDEERLAGGRSLTVVLDELRERPAVAGAPSLSKILGRSSFLLNEVALRDPATVLHDGDVLDILPPFAGG